MPLFMLKPRSNFVAGSLAMQMLTSNIQVHIYADTMHDSDTCNLSL